MRVEDVSYNEVVHAAEAVVAEGGTPSVRHVRKALGGESNNTITRFLRLWREEKESQNASTIERSALPEAILTEVQKVAVTL
ncbi:MAG: DNA-binding protein [Terracidiphilus sp.]|jgi:hypothetical protein